MSAERFDQYEVLREVGTLIDNLPSDERRQVMASLGERYGLKISDKPTGTTRGYRPYYGRKRAFS